MKNFKKNAAFGVVLVIVALSVWTCSDYAGSDKNPTKPKINEPLIGDDCPGGSCEASDRANKCKACCPEVKDPICSSGSRVISAFVSCGCETPASGNYSYGDISADAAQIAFQDSFIAFLNTNGFSSLASSAVNIKGYILANNGAAFGAELTNFNAIASTLTSTQVDMINNWIDSY
jgi:hypothetical protein